MRMRAIRTVKAFELSFSDNHRRRARVALRPQVLPVMQENQRKSKRVVVQESTPVNEADEALYRWFPPVPKANAAAAAAITAKSLDEATTTFEALHPNFAKRWTSSPNAISCFHPDESNRACLASTNTGNTSTTTNNTNNKKNGDNNGGPISPRAEAPAMPPRPSAATSQLLFLVRHGQTDMNKAGKLQGRGVNAHLNAAGLSQAEGLGHFVRNVPFDTVTSSSLHRAHETAMRIAELNVTCVERAQENAMPASGAVSPLHKEASSPESPPASSFCCGDKAQVLVRQFVGLDELSWGELEGQDSSAEPWNSRLTTLKTNWEHGNFDRAAKDGESLVEVQARASAALETLLDGGHGINLVVSHGRTLRILLLSLSGLGLDQMTNIGKIPNAGLYIIEARRSHPGAARTYHLVTPSG